MYCYNCWYFRNCGTGDEDFSPVCCSIGQKGPAEKCKKFTDDPHFSRLTAPLGLSPEEWQQKKKDAALAALKEVEENADN